ncbi:uncharacterized protein LOC126584353 [Malus sylvestris]|uniref:uncharacterized protein LOC126584353 n=1 Tax=Malus sylvestris TaxID=3752 RepID=UPI0021AD4C9E|nr:uncharacterized protein LOC126584353 [Malus sylvestris]
MCIAGGEIVGERYGLAGGTWPSCTRDGKVAFITNARERQDENKKKRTFRDKMKRVPWSSPRKLWSKKSPMEFTEEVVEEADRYNGFNLILADLCSRTMVYVTNRPNVVKYQSVL